MPRSRSAVLTLVLLAGCESSNDPVAPVLHLVFREQPANTIAGEVISPVVQVEIQDQSGNVFATAQHAVTLALGTNPGGGTLAGTTTVNAVNGVASFSDLWIDKAGAGYTLVADADTLTHLTSEAFTVAPGAAARLVFTVQPQSTYETMPIAPAVQVTIQDIFANVVSAATSAVTVALATNPGEGTLSGSTTLNAQFGIATFSDLRIDQPGAGYTLTATSGALASATSAAFVIRFMPANRTGAYERVTPHGSPDRHSRYVIRNDGRFELHDSKGLDTTLYTGTWKFATSYVGWPVEQDAVILLDFDGFDGDPFCGEAVGSFLLDGYLGIAYCGLIIGAGLEEGVYTSAPPPPLPPPPQNGQIAFVRDGRIYSANADGSAVVQLSDGPRDGTPAWSPDGNRIAFTRSSGDASGIFIMDADGANVLQRTTSGSYPTWSPDGKWIGFMCEQGICKVSGEADGTEPTPVYGHSGIVRYPAWSPRGDRIAFTSDAALFDIWFDVWLVAPDGSQLSALRQHTPQTPNADEQYEAAWSPDGGRIAHVECPWAYYYCSSSVVAVMNADGSGPTRLVVASGFAHPTWSPDGQVLAFASSNAIEWVSADGSQRGRIIDNGYSPAWRP